VRWGVVLALAASLATAGLLEWLLEGSAAKREALEGGVMLVAAAACSFTLSYWLVSKVERPRGSDLCARNRAGRGDAAAVWRSPRSPSSRLYREGFETVLFYKGAVTSVVAPAARRRSRWGWHRASSSPRRLHRNREKVRHPDPAATVLRRDGATLCFMAFVFAGTGVKELQEGALIPSTLVPGAPRSEFFGVYPTCSRWRSRD